MLFNFSPSGSGEGGRGGGSGGEEEAVVGEVCIATAGMERTSTSALTPLR